MNSNERSTSTTKKPIRIWVDGCFDLAHFGHANALRQASTLGDHLVVGIHSDKEILRCKGPTVFNEHERYRLIKAIKWVDEIVKDVPYTPTVELLDANDCDYIAHGDDLATTADGKDVYGDLKALGRYKEFKRTEGISTTDLVSRILARLKQPNTVAGRPLRRTHSVDSMPSFHETTTYSASGDTAANPTVETNPSEHVFNWSTGGMPYLPNSLRINQFCSSLREPQPEDVVVYVPGTFDLFHIGHLSFLEKCLELGNYILVGLHSDVTAARESKRMGTILTLQERLLSVLSCRYVSNVVIDPPYKIPASLLENFKVRYVVVGTDTKLLSLEDGQDPMVIPKQRGIFRRIDSGSSVTTTSVIQRILKSRVDFEKRNRAKELKEANIISSLRSSETQLNHLLAPSL